MLLDRILYTDAHLLVIDKPAGLAVHPGPRTPMSVEDHLDALRLGFQRRPRPAHRLDRDTSGCLVLGRHSKALKRLMALFAAGRIGKTYWAVVAGEPDEEGVIEAPLLKISSPTAGWRVVVDPRGKPARTRFQCLDRQAGRALVAFMPETGRTHQIRVHAAHRGWPILGDPVYGAGGDGQPMLLHARAIAIPYHEEKAPVRVTAPMPAPMRALGLRAGEDGAGD